MLYTQMNRVSIATNFVSQFVVQDAALQQMVRLDVGLYVVLARHVVSESKENLWDWLPDDAYFP